MGKFILRLIISALGILLVSYLLPGVHVKNFWIAIVLVAVLALLNTFIKPILVLFTLPVTIITLGLFLLVINALLVLLADAIIPGFIVDNFWWALLFSILVAIVNALLGGLAETS